MTRPALSLSLLVLLLGACALACKTRPRGGGDAGTGDAGPAADGGQAPLRCEQWGAPTPVGTVPTGAGLAELSGLAVSATDPDLLWVHNDSGDGPRLYALDRAGALRATFELTGVTARDWEDLALGPCPAGLGDAGAACLFAGDIGDNFAAYDSLWLHVLPEPAVAAGDPTAPRALEVAATVTLTYADGARDAEGLVVDAGGRPWLVTKGREGPPAVYTVDAALTDGATLTLRRAFTFAADDLDPASPWVTAADLELGGPRLLLRTYDSLLELTLDGPLSAATLGSATIRKVPAAVEPQGEAVAWEPGGRAYLTLSEQEGAISRVACAD